MSDDPPDEWAKDLRVCIERDFDGVTGEVAVLVPRQRGLHLGGDRAELGDDRSNDVRGAACPDVAKGTVELIHVAEAGALPLRHAREAGALDLVPGALREPDDSFEAVRGFSPVRELGQNVVDELVG